ANAIIDRLIISPATPTYRAWNHPNDRLNNFQNPFGESWPGLRTSAHKAGLSVSATNPEMVTDNAIVIANCLYNSPVIPPKNAAGTNTAASTKTLAITGPVTSVMDFFAASRGESPF